MINNVLGKHYRISKYCTIAPATGSRSPNGKHSERSRDPQLAFSILPRRPGQQSTFVLRLIRIPGSVPALTLCTTYASLFDSPQKCSTPRPSRYAYVSLLPLGFNLYSLVSIRYCYRLFSQSSGAKRVFTCHVCNLKGTTEVLGCHGNRNGSNYSVLSWKH